jgi:hypothetical protein
MEINNCPEEPWGRYSASGGLYRVPSAGQMYLYSFGGDTSSDGDGLGGVVRTNWRFALADLCWERLQSSPVEIGYRATATQVASLPDSVWLLFGADVSRAATDQVYQYSLSRDTWSVVPLKAADTPNSTESSAVTPAPRWKHAAVAIDKSRILVAGGRQGSTVHSDVWIFDTTDSTWHSSPLEIPPMFRHGMAFDPKRNVTWIYGGLDENLSRYQSQLWKLNLNTMEIRQAQVGGNNEDNDTSNSTPINNPLPPRLASQAMEYIQELDVLLMWGGTCGDDSELHIFDIESNTWCHIFPANRPDKRDAMLWSLRYPLFFIAQGDSICYNRQILPIADIHVMNLSSINNEEENMSWDMLYEPYNSRGTGNEPYCNGNNAGSCQPQPLLSDMSTQMSSCSADLLARFSSTPSSTSISLAPTTTPNTTSPSSPLQSPAPGDPAFAPTPTAIPITNTSGAFSSSSPSMIVPMLLLFAIKLVWHN